MRPEIEGRLHQAGFDAVQRKALHELTDEHIVQVVGHAPHEEERRDEAELQELPWRYEWPATAFVLDHDVRCQHAYLMPLH
jgi:hypothetical protein